MATDR